MNQHTIVQLLGDLIIQDSWLKMISEQPETTILCFVFCNLITFSRSVLYTELDDGPSESTVPT